MVYSTFDIVFAKLNTDGHIQGGVRPVVIVQNDTGNKFSPTLIVIPLTSKVKKLNQPTHGLIKASEENGLKVDSMLLGEQIMTINKECVKSKVGNIVNEKDIDTIRKVYLANLFGTKNVKVVAE